MKTARNLRGGVLVLRKVWPKKFFWKNIESKEHTEGVFQVHYVPKQNLFSSRFTTILLSVTLHINTQRTRVGSLDSKQKRNIMNSYFKKFNEALQVRLNIRTKRTGTRIGSARPALDTQASNITHISVPGLPRFSPGSAIFMFPPVYTADQAQQERVNELNQVC